jgi:hypothetical protein
MLNIESLRHSDENKYRPYLIIGQVFFVILSILSLGLYPLFLLIRNLHYQTLLCGNSIKVSENNYPEIHAIAKEYYNKLHLQKMPSIFICDENDISYSVIKNIHSSYYFCLRSDVVNYLIKENKMDEISGLIGYELGHHAAKHTLLYDSLYYEFATSIPIIGTLYCQACEFTADSIALQLTQNLNAYRNILIINSQGICTNNIDIDEFVAQEIDISLQARFVHMFLSKKARITRRIIELKPLNK